jgi:hypothetical protein
MRHMVVQGSIDGGSTYNETEDLDSALRAVERLRNSQNITDTRIYSLHEVPIEFKTYYLVEVVAAPEPSFEPQPVPEPVAAAEPMLETMIASPADPPPRMEWAPAESTAEPEGGFTAPTPVLPAASGRFGLFSRG